MINKQRGLGVTHKENGRCWNKLLKGLPLASMASLLILYTCSATNSENNKIDTRGEMKIMEQAENSSALEISLPPIDKIVPMKTQTATFALG